MKCPIDQTDMEKGILISQGGVWWSSGGLSLLGKGISAYKCSKCGKIELYIKIKGAK